MLENKWKPLQCEWKRLEYPLELTFRGSMGYGSMGYYVTIGMGIGTSQDFNHMGLFPHIARMYKKFYRISKASFLDTLCVDTSHPTTRSVRGVHKTTECDHVSSLTTIMEYRSEPPLKFDHSSNKSDFQCCQTLT